MSKEEHTVVDSDYSKPSKHEAGSALISILVAVAILGLVVSLYARTSKGLDTSAAQIRHQAKFDLIESAFVTELSNIVRNLELNNCLTEAVLHDRSFGYGEASSRMTLVRTIAGAGGDRGSDANSVEPLKGLNTRCSQPTFIRDSSFSDRSKSHLYFCVQIGTRQTLNRATLLPTFAEVAIDIEDATNSERTSCEAFLTKGSTVARVTYGLYMGQDRVESKEKYSRKLGSVIFKSLNGN